MARPPKRLELHGEELHPEPVLEELLASPPSMALWAQVLLHLSHRCPQCQVKYGELGDLVAEGYLPVELTFSFEEFVRARERRQGEALLRRFEELTSAERDAALARDPTYLQADFARLLADACHRAARTAPRQAVGLGRWAVTVAEALAAEGEAEAMELAMLARACRGNARRVHDRLKGAASDFAAAEAWWQRLEGPPVHPEHRGRTLSLRASLETDLRRYAKSLVTLGDLEELGRYHAPHLDALRATGWLLRGRIQHWQDDLPMAIVSLERAEQVAQNASMNDAFWLAMRSNRALFLTRAGRNDAGAAQLPACQQLLERVGTRAERLSMTYLEGLILGGLGKVDRAKEQIAAARTGFLRLKRGYDAALASLDLALLHLQEGHHEEVKRLAAEMHVVFRFHDIGDEARAALVLFARAAAAENASHELVRSLAAYLHRARHQPDLKFEARPTP